MAVNVKRPHVIVLDFGLPGADGITVYQRLRKVPETAGTAIVFISGRTTQEINDALKKAGVKELVNAKFLPKPFAFKKLAEVIDKMVPKASG